MIKKYDYITIGLDITVQIYEDSYLETQYEPEMILIYIAM